MRQFHTQHLGRAQGPSWACCGGEAVGAEEGSPRVTRGCRAGFPEQGARWAPDGQRVLAVGQEESRAVPGDRSLRQGDAGVLGSLGGGVFLEGSLA